MWQSTPSISYSAYASLINAKKRSKFARRSYLLKEAISDAKLVRSAPIFCTKKVSIRMLW